MSTHAANPDFDRQTTLPPGVARRLNYEAGSALGIRAGAGEARFWGLLLDACVLTVRHDSVSEAARLMHVAEAGLQGFLDGAGAEAQRLIALGRGTTPGAPA
jgi:hypothetical protein